jgi:CTP-dependent riboflavin kinase
MEFLTQEGLKLVLAMVLGGIVQGVRSHLQKTMQEKLEDLNFRRDLDHVTRTQAQHGQLMADLDVKVDKIINYIQRQDSRILSLESQIRVLQASRH